LLLVHIMINVCTFWEICVLFAMSVFIKLVLDLCTCSTTTFSNNNNDDWLLLFTARA